MLDEGSIPSSSGPGAMPRGNGNLQLYKKSIGLITDGLLAFPQNLEKRRLAP